MKKKIKILFISKESRGGMETVLNQLSQIDSKKFKKYYCLYKKDKLAKKNKEYIYLQNIQSNQIYFSFKKILGFTENLLSTIKTLKILKPDIVFALDIYSIVVISIIKFLKIYRGVCISLVNTNFPVIVNQKPGFYYRSLLKCFVFISTKYIDKFIFTSKSLVIDFIKNYNCDAHKTICINNSVDHAFISKLKNISIDIVKKNILNNKDYKLFCVGRLDNQKDVSTIIRAFSIINRKIDNTRLYVIGEGDQKKKLIGEAKRLRITNKIFFLGWQRNIYMYLKYADIFVFSSFYEGFAMVVIEAMALGIPVVATNTPFGPSEIIGKHNKYGYLVPMKNHNKMAKRILELLTSKKTIEKYSNLSLKRSKDFDIKKMLTKYENLLTNLKK